MTHPLLLSLLGAAFQERLERTDALVGLPLTSALGGVRGHRPRLTGHLLDRAHVIGNSPRCPAVKRSWLDGLLGLHLADQPTGPQAGDDLVGLGAGWRLH